MADPSWQLLAASAARDQEGAVRGVIRSGAERRALPILRRRRHAAGRIPVHPARIRPQRRQRTALLGGQRPHVVRVGGVPERPLPDAGRRRTGNVQHGPGLLTLVQPGTRPLGGRVSTHGLRQWPPGGVQGLLGRRQGGIRQPCVPARFRRRWRDVARPAAREVRGRRGLRRPRLAQPRFPAEQPGASSPATARSRSRRTETSSFPCAPTSPPAAGPWVWM